MSNLSRLTTPSAADLLKQITKSKNAVNIAGQDFGRLRAIRPVPSPSEIKQRTICWECICTCGNTTIVEGRLLRSGHTSSCGCLQRERSKENNKINPSRLTHGHTRQFTASPTYTTWRSMIARCTKPDHKSYGYYGARGVKVHQPWLDSFEQFLADVGERPKGKTLDRIDSDGHYEPGNVKWSTPLEQIQNRRPRQPAKIA